MTDEWTVELLERTAVGPDIVTLQFAAPRGFDARPGEFVLLRAPGLGGRHYTVSSPDSETDFELTVDLAAGGPVAGWLAERPLGTTVEIEGPFGRTYYAGGDAVAIGGGSGIGAAVGVAERAVREGNDAAVIAAGMLVHEARLRALASTGTSVYVASTDLGAAIRTGLDGRAAYVFGFQGFIDRVRAAVAAARIDPDRVSYESYGTR